MTEYLDLDDLLAAAEAAVGGPVELRDIGLLDAAAARPRASVFGADAYPDLDTKAAALLHSIVTGHPLVDGNKRLAWVSVRLFYLLNDTDVRPTTDAAYELVVAVADGTLRDVEPIAQPLADWRRLAARRPAAAPRSCLRDRRVFRSPGFPDQATETSGTGGRHAQSTPRPVGSKGPGTTDRS